MGYKKNQFCQLYLLDGNGTIIILVIELLIEFWAFIKVLF